LRFGVSRPIHRVCYWHDINSAPERQNKHSSLSLEAKQLGHGMARAGQDQDLIAAYFDAKRHRP
jgi:hypothetical protein